MEKLKVLFMGTPEFAASSLQALIDNNIDVIGCFTNVDKPSGRGMKLKFSPVKELAIKNNIPVYQPVKLRNNQEVLDIIQKLDPNLIVVVAYGKILPKEILEYPKLGSINVHGSLLPKYRGAAPIQWALINGEKVTGITTMYMDEGMDTGDMLLKQEVNIEDSDDYESLYNKLKNVGASLLIKTLDKISNNTAIRIKQQDGATIAPMITKEMSKIDFNKNGVEIFNLVRGLSPNPGCTIQINENTKFKIYKVQYEKKTDIDSIPNGKVVDINKNNLSIKCNDGIIKILEIQPPNSRKMDVKAFLAGNNKIDINTKFS